MSGTTPPVDPSLNADASTSSSSITRDRIQPGVPHASTPPRNRRQRSLSSETEDEVSHTESETQSSEPPTSSRRVAKRPRIVLPQSAAVTSLGSRTTSPSASRNSTSAIQTPPPAASYPPPSASPAPIASGSSSRSSARPRARRPPPTRPSQIHDAIVIDSSDESDEDAVMASVVVPPAEIIGTASGPSSSRLPGRPLSPRRVARQNLASRPNGPSTPSGAYSDPDSSIHVERVVRRPPPIEILDDSLVEEGSAALRAASQIAADLDLAPSPPPPPGLRRVQVSPPRTKPPPVAHPLLSKYTCPICFCAPFPHVVSTPCGHVFCSECLFEALQVPAKQKQDALRDQMAAFTSLSTLQRMGGGIGGAIGNALGLGGGGGGEAHAPLRDGSGNIVGGQNPPTNGSNENAGNETPTTASGAPPPKINPLVGICPVCRAEIPGGFIAGHRPAAKRSVFGLELKIGKPIDDPRREEAGTVFGGKH
ncbi:hypothetical protein BCV69DRAFT_279788 [Microstroma glucosiphilum]|uniref:RING-type domain-containing protein n=1 Tax=Pseudomicrostroma glucosiphilum TaxID=1684307 RepID=A0A316UF97_9BASI|nr:hypothetical protein BCV69DRAFT_279788 [Pseudomicrostroma glucosiphilum]PWN23880.1 hypothetical protein BCV69DRAFT_279788 [Pseudomicrostroma glucosiphilum]